jgi:hypothetical protein
MGDTGSTGSSEDAVLIPYPTISGPPIPEYIMTIDQLTQYHNTTVQSEMSDKVSMDVIVSPNSSGIQQSLIQWASIGFPHDYQILSVNLIFPLRCSDGQVRDMMSYICYLTGSEIMTLTTNFQSNFFGIYFSYSISGNTVNLHVSKLPPT